MSASGKPFLPYGRHQIDEDDVAAVIAVLRSGSLTGGPLVAEFETAFAKRVGARYAVACANGTAGLHLAAMALGIGPDHAVIVPTLTFLATASAARRWGGICWHERANVRHHRGAHVLDAVAGYCFEIGVGGVNAIK